MCGILPLTLYYGMGLSPYDDLNDLTLNNLKIFLLKILPLSPQVELSMTYGCEEQMSRRTLLRYIHQNRNYNSLKINTMGG